jgi:hypothetical protein
MNNVITTGFLWILLFQAVRGRDLLFAEEGKLTLGVQ